MDIIHINQPDAAQKRTSDEDITCVGGAKRSKTGEDGVKILPTIVGDAPCPAPDIGFCSALDTLVMCATEGVKRNGEVPVAPSVDRGQAACQRPHVLSHQYPSVSRARKITPSPTADSASSGESQQYSNRGVDERDDVKGTSVKLHRGLSTATLDNSVPTPTDDACALCFKVRREGEDFRDVRNIHVHWARLMEMLPSHTLYLSEWTSRRQYYQFDPSIKLEKHFKCFTHEQIMFAFDGLDTGKRCHKHCLHAFNFTVKTRFEQFARDTGYAGAPPDFVKFSKTDMPRQAVVAYPYPHPITTLFPALGHTPATSHTHAPAHHRATSTSKPSPQQSLSQPHQSLSQPQSQSRALDGMVMVSGPGGAGYYPMSMSHTMSGSMPMPMMMTSSGMPLHYVTYTTPSTTTTAPLTTLTPPVHTHHQAATTVMYNYPPPPMPQQYHPSMYGTMPYFHLSQSQSQSQSYSHSGDGVVMPQHSLYTHAATPMAMSMAQDGMYYQSYHHVPHTATLTVPTN